MLFDLRSPGRRRVIKVIYGGLAFLMAGGLIFFGIGSDASGGLSEIFSGNSGEDTGFEDQIDDANERLETNPQDKAALIELVEAHYRAGTSRIEIDEETGQQDITAEAEEELQRGADAWDQLQKVSGKQGAPSSTALLAVQIFSTIAQGDLADAAAGSGQEALDHADDSLANWQAAAEAQEVATGQRKDAESYANLAVYLYSAGNFEAGDAAAQQAAAAAKGDEAKELEKELKGAEQQARQISTAIESYRKQLAKAGAQAGAPGGGATGENPLSGIGGGGLGGGALGAP
jgi:hypothetical protein